MLGDGRGEVEKEKMCIAPCPHKTVELHSKGAGKSVLHWEIGMLLEILDGAF